MFDVTAAPNERGVDAATVDGDGNKVRQEDRDADGEGASAGMCGVVAPRVWSVAANTTKTKSAVRTISVPRPLPTVTCKSRVQRSSTAECTNV
jgi:hypothetical protein